MILGVTGTFGSGKSSISRILANILDAELLSADKLCNEELLEGRRGLEKVEQRWGGRFVELNERGKRLKRQAMRQAVFTDSTIRTELEKILHPLAYQGIERKVAQIKQKRGWLIVEVPLLFEQEWIEPFDSIVVVRIAEEQIFERVLQRDGRSFSEIERILSLQMPQAQKIARADHVIDNSGIFSTTFAQCVWLATWLRHSTLPV